MRLSPVVEVQAQRVPTEVTAQWFGTETGAVWPISSYADEPIPDDDLVTARARRTSARRSSRRSPASGSIAPARCMRFSFALTVSRPRWPSPASDAAAGPAIGRSADQARLRHQRSDGGAAVLARGLAARRRADVYYIGIKLDASGLLDNWSLRDATQEALDNRFTETLWLHQTDPLWVASQSHFNAEQAESYKLEALRIVFGKRPGVDMRLHPGTYSVVCGRCASRSTARRRARTSTVGSSPRSVRANERRRTFRRTPRTRATAPCSSIRWFPNRPKVFASRWPADRRRFA